MIERCTNCQGFHDLDYVAKWTKHKRPRIIVQVYCGQCGSFSHNVQSDLVSKAIEDLVFKTFGSPPLRASDVSFLLEVSDVSVPC